MPDTLKGKFAEIADAIREKSGKSEKIVANNFPEAIRAIDTNLFPPDKIPEYVKAEALSVAERVKALQTPRTITFVGVSDSHYINGQSTAEANMVNTANLHMAMAAKIIGYAIPVDFYAHFGDFAWALISTPREMTIRQIEELNALLGESYPYFPQLRTVGNHDTGEYRARQTGSLSDLTGVPTLKRLICDYNQGAVYGDADYGYCYRDFPSKKFRVINVNTCERESVEGEDATPTMSQEQLAWAAQTMLDTGDKAGWSFMLMGHYPADFGWTVQLAHIIHAYIDGASVTMGGKAYDFAGHNQAKFVAHVHGHLHNYRTEKIRDTPNGNPNLNPAEFDAREICIPNSLPMSDNERTKPYWGIVYAEEKTYHKTQGTKEDTAFTVNVIDPDKQTFTSIHYGAGYDRTIGYAATVYYNIQTDLTNASLTNGAISVEDGQPYTTDITLADKYQLDSVRVTMGGNDITGQVVSGQKIAIPAVTGDVTITVVASKPVTYTNLVPTSIDRDGNIYNGVGYKEDTQVHHGVDDYYGGETATGYIEIKTALPFVIRAGGTAEKNFATYPNEITFFDASKTYIGAQPLSRAGSAPNFGELVDETYPNQAFAWRATRQTAYVANAKFFRLTIRTGGDGDGLIVTIDEPIE